MPELILARRRFLFQRRLTHLFPRQRNPIQPGNLLPAQEVTQVRGVFYDIVQTAQLNLWESRRHLAAVARRQWLP